MPFERPPMPSPEEMAKIEKERTLSDAELLKGGAEYKFDEKGEKILEATEEQVEKIREEMEKDLEARKSVEKKAGEKVIKRREIKNGKDLGYTEFKYDKEGRLFMEFSGEYDNLLRSKPFEKLYCYHKNGKLSYEIINEYKHGSFQTKDNWYDENGNLIRQKWELRPYGRPMDSYGEMNFENELDEMGRLVKSIGKGKSDTYVELVINNYRYDSEKNLITRQENGIRKFFAGSLADREEKFETLYFNQYDNEDKLVSEGAFYTNTEGKKVQKITLFFYNEIGDLIRKGEQLKIGEEVKEKAVSDYELEYGSVEKSSDKKR